MLNSQQGKSYPLVLFAGCASPSSVLEPELRYFPERLCARRVFPQATSQFLFPGPLRLHEEAPALRVHYFSFCDGGGRCVFGASAVFGLQVEHGGVPLEADCCLFVLLSQPLLYRFEAVLAYFARRVRALADLGGAANQLY